MVSTMESVLRLRPEAIRLLVPTLAAVLVLMLGACGHARVVHRDYETPSRAQPPRPSRAASRAEVEPLPRGGVHIVRPGETLYGISFRFGLRFQDVAAWNGIADPFVIEVGQRLRLQPATDGSRPVVVAPAPARPTASAPTPAWRTPSAPRPGDVGSIPPRGANPPPVVVAPPSERVAPILGAPSWRWPTVGQVVGRYVAGDQTQQGINIAGSAGQPVQASADGVVVYSGAGLVGYGELIIIKHNDEWLSAYAHNRRRMVSEGTRVKAGDTIAEMGRTGASRDMLHFEIRRNGKPVDPLAFLPSR